MNLSIRVLGKIIIGIFLLFFSVQEMQAQTLETEADPKTMKGHALYKQMKIYDSKYGPSDKKPKAPGDRAADRINYEFNKLKNPFTGQIPIKYQRFGIRVF